MSRLGSRLKRFMPERLPPLRGWWLQAYTALFALLFIMAIGMAGIGLWKAIDPPSYEWPYYGLYVTPDGPSVSWVSGAEAANKGIAAGQRIVAIDGTDVGAIREGSAAAQLVLDGPKGATVALTLRTADGQLRTHELTRNAAHGRLVELYRGIDSWTGLLEMAAFLGAALLLFRRRREPVPAILALCFMFAATLNTEAAAWLDQYWLTRRLNIAFWSLLPLGVLLFPDGRLGSVASLGTAIAIGCVSLWRMVDLSVDRVVGLLVVLAFLALGLIRLVRRYHRLPRGPQRQQVRWAVFGLATGSGLLLVCGSIWAIAVQFLDPWTTILGIIVDLAFTLAVLCIVGGLLISLIRYRLYDADAVIGRSAAYGVLTLGFVAVFAGSLELIQTLGRIYLGEQIGALAGGIGAAVAAVLIVPLHGRVNRWAERRFQKDVVRLRSSLPRLVRDLRETASVAQIGGAIAESAARGVQATRAAVIANGDVIAARGLDVAAVRAWAAERDISAEPAKVARKDLTFPLRVPLASEGTGHVGWLVLGPRPDGSFFGKDEREALAEVAEPVARAIDIAKTREGREAEMRDLMRRLEARIASLEDVIAIPPSPGLAG